MKWMKNYADEWRFDQVSIGERVARRESVNLFVILFQILFKLKLQSQFSDFKGARVFVYGKLWARLRVLTHRWIFIKS